MRDDEKRKIDNRLKEKGWAWNQNDQQYQKNGKNAVWGQDSIKVDGSVYNAPSDVYKSKKV